MIRVRRRDFERRDERLGRFTARPVEPAADAEMVHGWLTHPKAAFWLMQDTSLPEVGRYFEAIAASPFEEAFVGLHAGRPTFLVERYDPAHGELSQAYAVQQGDVGMHFLVAPTDRPLRGFTRAVIATAMELLFSDGRVRRVVVDPDVRNHAVHALNAAVGFRMLGTVSLHDKRALLSVCTREQYRAARVGTAA